MSKKNVIRKKDIKKKLKLEEKIFKLILKARSSKEPVDAQLASILEFVEEIEFCLKEIVKEIHEEKAKAVAKEEPEATVVVEEVVNVDEDKTEEAAPAKAEETPVADAGVEVIAPAQEPAEPKKAKAKKAGKKSRTKKSRK